MGNKKMGTRKSPRNQREKIRYGRPSWVPKTASSEAELCPDCFKVVGEKSRYNLVCMLGQVKEGMTVSELTERTKLRQPTVTHHLQILHSVEAVTSMSRGREKIYTLNRKAHCFEECKIPY